MSGTLAFLLLAVHIADGVLTQTWLFGGFAGAAGLALFGAWRIRDEEIPRVALLTAAFFVASLVHVRVPPTSVHLILNGLMGVVLGRRAAVAIPVGLFLQAVLLGHGGLTVLGVNTCIMALPALLAWQLFAGLRCVPFARQPWFRTVLVAFCALTWSLTSVYAVTLLWTNAAEESSIALANHLTVHPFTLTVALVVAALAVWVERRLENAPEFPIGFLIGEISVLATILLNSLALAWGSPEHWQTLAAWIFVAHLPIALVEGIILGFTISFLIRVKPEMLGWPVAEKAKCSVDAAP
jgi:cobalt/nickel transport system permease protein